MPYKEAELSTMVTATSKAPDSELVGALEQVSESGLMVTDDDVDVTDGVTDGAVHADEQQHYQSWRLIAKHYCAPHYLDWLSLWSIHHVAIRTWCESANFFKIDFCAMMPLSLPACHAAQAGSAVCSVIWVSANCSFMTETQQPKPLLSLLSKVHR